MEQEKVINIKIPAELHKRLRICSMIEDVTLKDYIIGVLGQHIREQEGVTFTESKAETAPKKGKKRR